MLLHKDHQFIYDHCAAIELPDNVYFDPNPDACPNEGMVLFSEDLCTQVVFNFFKTEQDAWSFLKELKDHFEDFDITEPIRAVCINGLVGFGVSFTAGRYVYEEYSLAIPGDEPALLNIYFEQKEDKLSNSAIYTQTRDGVLKGIKKTC